LTKFLLFLYQVDMPPTYSVMTTPASGINRIQKTNLPQTPQKCNDCSDDDKWFNTRDALLVILLNLI
jgi:hypothetical protein